MRLCGFLAGRTRDRRPARRRRAGRRRRIPGAGQGARPFQRLQLRRGDRRRFGGAQGAAVGRCGRADRRAGAARALPPERQRDRAGGSPRGAARGEVRVPVATRSGGSADRPGPGALLRRGVRRRRRSVRHGARKGHAARRPRPDAAAGLVGNGARPRGATAGRGSPRVGLRADRRADGPGTARRNYGACGTPRIGLRSDWRADGPGPRTRSSRSSSSARAGMSCWAWSATSARS